MCFVVFLVSCFVVVKGPKRIPKQYRTEPQKHTTAHITKHYPQQTRTAQQQPSPPKRATTNLKPSKHTNKTPSKRTHHTTKQAKTQVPNSDPQNQQHNKRTLERWSTRRHHSTTTTTKHSHNSTKHIPKPQSKRSSTQTQQHNKHTLKPLSPEIVF